MARRDEEKRLLNTYRTYIKNAQADQEQLEKVDAQKATLKQQRNILCFSASLMLCQFPSLRAALFSTPQKIRCPYLRGLHNTEDLQTIQIDAIYSSLRIHNHAHHSLPPQSTASAHQLPSIFLHPTPKNRRPYLCGLHNTKTPKIFYFRPCDSAHPPKKPAFSICRLR